MDEWITFSLEEFWAMERKWKGLVGDGGGGRLIAGSITDLESFDWISFQSSWLG